MQISDSCIDLYVQYRKLVYEIDPLTASAIKGYSNPSNGGTGIDSLPDILALEEVDSMDALRLFNDFIDGNDIRRIDVGLLSKFKIKSISTNIQRSPSTIHQWCSLFYCLPRKRFGTHLVIKP